MYEFYYNYAYFSEEGPECDGNTTEVHHYDTLLIASVNICLMQVTGKEGGFTGKEVGHTCYDDD